jgi:hypothetical protein
MNINKGDVIEVKTYRDKTLRFEVRDIETTDDNKYTTLRVVRIIFAKDINEWVGHGYNHCLYLNNENQKLLGYPEYKNIGKLR